MRIFNVLEGRAGYVDGIVPPSAGPGAKQILLPCRQYLPTGLRLEDRP
jgi:hypothetical protein